MVLVDSYGIVENEPAVVDFYSIGENEPIMVAYKHNSLNNQLCLR